MNELDLAWAAGFIDGEGSIVITKRTKTRQPFSYELSLQVRQLNRAPLEKLTNMFGGSIYESSQPIYYTQWWARKASEIIEAVEPYLVGKHEEAQLALLFQSRKRRGHAANYDLDEEQYIAMRSLKRRSLNE